MSSFSLTIAVPRPDAEGRARGLLQVGDDDILFPMPLRHWTLEEYRDHWVESLVGLLQTRQPVTLVFSQGPEGPERSWWCAVSGDQVTLTPQPETHDSPRRVPLSSISRFLERMGQGPF